LIELFRRNFLAIEGLCVVGGAIVLVACIDRGWLVFIEGGSDNIAVLSALVGFFGTMLGFVIGVVTFLFGASDNNAFRVLRASESYRAHWSIFKGALFSCFVATFLSVGAIIAAWFSILYKLHGAAVVGAGLWVFVRLIRVVWVLKHLIDGEVRLGAASRERVSRH
jgi:hypothetical protein